MVKVIKSKSKIGPREQAVRDMREGNDLSIPDFLKRTEPIQKSTTPKPTQAKPAKTASEPLATPADDKKPATQESATMRTKTNGKKAAAGKARTPVAKAAASKGIRPGTKLEAIVSLLCRPKGCTTKDVLKETGWPAVSMPAQAKAAGLKLRKEKIDGVTHYFAA